LHGTLTYLFPLLTPAYSSACGPVESPAASTYTTLNLSHHSCQLLLAPIYIGVYLIGMQETIKQVAGVAPGVKEWKARLTEGLKNAQVDTLTAFQLDYPTVIAFRAYAIRKGWKIVQRKEGNNYLVWRVA
jgi:hypothetical protein